MRYVTVQRTVRTQTPRFFSLTNSSWTSWWNSLRRAEHERASEEPAPALVASLRSITLNMNPTQTPTTLEAAAAVSMSDILKSLKMFSSHRFNTELNLTLPQTFPRDCGRIHGLMAFPARQRGTTGAVQTGADGSRAKKKKKKKKEEEEEEEEEKLNLGQILRLELQHIDFNSLTPEK
ncbi:uncharacterized protein V6R79_021671 [Siganus canaliculatus]